MSALWPRLSETDLRQLSGALRAGRLIPPFGAVGIRRYLAAELADAVADEMQRLHRAGMNAPHLALLLETLVGRLVCPSP